MPRYKKQKEYSTSYEKKISIDPMTEALSREDSPNLSGAIAATAKKFTPSGRAITAMKKSPKTSAGTAGVLGGTGIGYAAGRYDEKNSNSKPTPDEMGLEDETLEPGKEYLEKAKGGMIVARGSRLVKVKPTKLY